MTPSTLLSLRFSFLPLLVLLILGLLSSTTSAHRIDVAPGVKECFFEDLHVEDQVRLGLFACSAWVAK
jgi:hypothetical protein